MFQKIWNAILGLLGLGNTRWASPRTQSAKGDPLTRKTLNASPTLQPNPAKRPIPRKLYDGKGFHIKEQHIERAADMLFRIEQGKKKGPTPKQEEVIYSDFAATAVLAGAGSGKSTTLVSRVLFLHKYLEVPFSNMAVFTFTRKSRADFIEKLVEEAEKWGIQLNKKKAEQLVRTFHSKALQVARGILGDDERIFEFLGKEKCASNKKENTEITTAAVSAEDAMSPEEQEANKIEGFVELNESTEQAEILKDVYSKCYNADEKFRKAIAVLFEYTMTTLPKQPDKRYEDKLAFIDSISKKDEKLCDHLEETWSQQGCWPIPGMESRKKDGSRFGLSVMGTPFFANGYIESLNIYIVLGRYEGISNSEISVGKIKLKPSFAVNDKQLILLTGCKEKIRYVKSRKDAENLRIQLELKAGNKGLSAPALEIKLPGERIAKEVFSALHAFGTFSENLGLQPNKLITQLNISELSEAESSAIYATSRFFDEFYAELKTNRLVTFNQIFAQLSGKSPDLKKVGIGPLMGVKHLMIDEFQDISPLIVKFVLGLHSELIEKAEGTQRPSIMCVGDDWQSIYGWRGSSPHFFLSFHDYFPGAPPEPILLQENFRSSQEIINCGESFIKRVNKKSRKRGIASNNKVKDLPFKVVAVEEFKPEDISNALNALLEKADANEKVYLLAATHNELKPFGKFNDTKLTMTTFHQSKGLEADYVILLGTQSHFGSNNLKNHLYKLAEFPQTFDEAQLDESFRVAYVAATRAKKLCIWFAKPESSNVIGQVPADGKGRRAIQCHEVVPYIQECLQTCQISVQPA